MPGRRPLIDLPLRWRLIIVVLAVSLIALSSTTFATTFFLRDYLQKRVDADLVRTSEELAEVDYQSLLNLSPSDRQRYIAPNTYRIEFIPVYTDGALQTGGVILLPDDRSNSAPDLPELSPTDRRVESGDPFTVHSMDGKSRWRVRAGLTTGGDMVWLIATPLQPTENTVARVTTLGVALGVIALAICLVFAWLLIHEAFRPLREMEATAAGIASGDLTRRVPDRRSKDEVASLAASLNVMLGQIERSFATTEASEQRMRQFVADASHELRTPLAVVRGYAELYRQGGLRGDEQVGTAMGRIEDESRRLSLLVEELLSLTRATDPATTRVNDLDLLIVASEVVQDARVIAPGRDIRIVGLDGVLAPVEMRGHEPGLRQVVGNIVANAVRHTPAGSSVQVAVGRRGDTARLEVRDHGEGIPPELRAKVFERFYRADPSRNRAQGGGSGLGLAIVAALVAAHGGRVHVEETPGGGATFVVELPVTGPTETSLARHGDIRAEQSAVTTSRTGPLRLPRR